MKTLQFQPNVKSKLSKIITIFVSLLLAGTSLFGQKVDILGSARVTGQLEVMDTILFADGTELASACLQILQDGDSDTKIEVEKSTDEDIIRFTIDGNEIAKFVDNRLEIADGGGSVFIGYEAGAADDATDNKSVYIGWETGRNSTGFGNTGIGANSLTENNLGQENTSIGASAGYLSDGSNNVFVGRDAGRVAMNGNNNTYVGHDAGRSASGSGNVFLGKSAGETLTGNNKLAIDNTNSPSPLIYGEFDNNKLQVNGTLTLNDSQNLGQANFTIHDTDGNFGGMYVNATATGKPFYGYALGGQVKAYEFLDEQNNWTFFKIGQALHLNANNNLMIGGGNATERLEVAGAIKIGNSFSENPGTIRFTNGDFQGRTNAGWTSLTGSGGASDNDWAISGTNIYRASGNVGIGNSNPTSRLHVTGNSTVDGRFRVNNNDLMISNLQGDSDKGIKFGSTTTGLIGLTFENQGNYQDKLHFKTFYDQVGASFMTMNGANGRIGMGVTSPETKLHVKATNGTGHIMKIENVSNSVNADGLEIKINRPVSGAGNNFVTFRNANATAGRIEGFQLGEGPNFTDFPGIDINAYFDVMGMVDAIFDPGFPSYPLLNTMQLPDPGSLPSLSGGSFGSLNLNVDFDDLADNLECQANPFCNNYVEWITGGISGASFPNLNPGSLPSLSGGVLPSLSGGILPSFNLYGLINPQIIATASTDINNIINWGLENGIEALSADPWRIKLMNDPQYWSNIAKQKHGGVTYGSKGADYAEWLEREDPSQEIKAGQIVGVKNGKISLNTEDADQIMAISVMPVVLGNMPDSTRQTDFEKVAFIGQTPVWVVGEVESGDYIIASGQNDGYGLAIAEDELELEMVSRVVGRAWEDSDKIINLVNVAVGLKTSEVAGILSRTAEKVKKVEDRLAKVEAALGIESLAHK